MVVDTKLYDLLGVAPSASESEIKSAYKKLALRLHPDKNPGDDAAAEKFKDVSKAAATLTDADKRRLYDSTGNDGDEQDSGPDPSDIFAMFFGQGFGGGGGFRTRRATQRTKDFVHELQLTLEELYAGKTIKLALNRAIICSGCKGSGGRPGATYICTACNGAGVCLITQQTGPMFQQYQTPCRSCCGTGGGVPDKERCSCCRGKRTTDDRKVFEVHVRPGMREGQRTVFRDEAGQEPGKTPGDVIFVIKEKPHSTFRRDREHLFAEVQVDLLTALTGGEVPLKHLDGTTLFLQVKEGDVLTPDCNRMVADRGFPVENMPTHGDLYLKISVIFPTRAELSQERISLLRAALPASRQATKTTGPCPANSEICVMQEVVRRQRRSAGRQEHDQDEEDDDGGQGRQRMQCATQ